MQDCSKQELIAERYVLGELSADERDAFEEHLFSCSKCAEDVRDLVALQSGARAVFAETAAAPLPKERGVGNWRQAFALVGLRPVYGLAAAAAVVLVTASAAYLGGRAMSRNEPIALAAVVVKPEARGAQTVVDLGAGQGPLLLEADAPAGAQVVDWEMRNRNDNSIVGRGTVPAPPPGATLKFLIPREKVQVGEYELRLWDDQSAKPSATTLAHFVTIRGD